MGYDNDHTVHVFKADGSKVGSVNSGSDPMVDLAWHPSNHTFACAAKRGVTLFSVSGSGVSKDGNGQYGSNPREPMTCVTYGPDGTCYTGSFKGKVFAWSGKSCKGNQSVGKRMINGICATKDALYVGADYSIEVLDHGFSKKNSISVRADPRAIDVRDDNILAGLRDGSIVEIKNGNQTVLMESHSDGEVWGLDIDADTGNVITSCDDNKVYVWNPD